MRYAKKVLPLLLLSIGVSTLTQTHTAAQGRSALPSEVTLHQLMELAEHAPRVRAAQLLAEAVRGDVRTAGTPPNPVLSWNLAGLLTSRDTATNGGTQQQATLTQTFYWPGQMDSRVRAAEADLEAARASVTRSRAELRIELARAFVDLLTAQERTDVLASAHADIERVARVIAERRRTNTGRPWDVIRIESELASLDAQRNVSRAEEAESAGRIGVLLGVRDYFPRASGAWNGLAHTPPTSDQADLGHPVVDYAHRATLAARARAASERTLAIPPIDMTLGSIVSTDPDGVYLYGGLSWPLAIFDQNEGAIERAEREADAAQMLEDATREALRASLTRAQRLFENRQAALRAFEQGAIARLPELAQMAEIAFAAGEVSVFEVLDAVRAARELRLEALERASSLRMAEIDVLEAAQGSL